VLGLRNSAGINVRQPLPRILVVTGSNVEEDIVRSVGDIIRDEVNIKKIEFVSGSSDVVDRSAKPNFAALGKRLGPLMKPVNQAVRAFGEEEISTFLNEGSIDVDAGEETVTLSGDDIEIVSEGVEGWLVDQSDGVTVALDTTVSEELRLEGLAREVVNRVQNMRKQAGFDVTDRIVMHVEGSDRIIRAIEKHTGQIRNETLCIELQLAPNPGGDLINTFEIDADQFTVGVAKAG